MTTGAIIAIVVVALIIVALLAFVMPRMRTRARVRRRERELESRREHVAGEHRREAELREREATEAEQRGMADHELVEDDERDRFAGTSAVESDTPGERGRFHRESMADAEARDTETETEETRR